MTKNLFDNENAIFMGAKRSPDNCSIGIFGVNYDGTCSFKPGARFGPEAIRQVSSCLETYCPKLNKDLEDIMYVDFGSIIIDKNDSKSVIESVKSATNSLISKRLSPIMLGGEHSITRGAIEALVKKYPDLILVQLDAHADLRESGSIEQDADVVMFVYREGYYLQRKEPREATVEHAEWQAKMNEVSNLAEIIIGKQRHGPTGNIMLEFEAMFTKFKDIQNN